MKSAVLFVSIEFYVTLFSPLKRIIDIGGEQFHVNCFLCNLNMFVSLLKFMSVFNLWLYRAFRDLSIPAGSLFWSLFPPMSLSVHVKQPEKR